MSDNRLHPGDRVRVVQLQATGYEHLRAFDEVAASLAEGLTEAGFDVETATDAATGRRNIVLGAHLLSPEGLRALPRGTIVYNHEQIDEASMLPTSRLPTFRSLGVWDYSARNVAAWAAHGIDAAHVPIGWSPGLAHVDRDTVRDIDVLFYGSLNERRQRILDALSRRGARVEVAFGVYGEARDALLSRARLVVNIQFYEARILEMVRLSYLFANGIPVVSETAPGIDVPPGFGDAAAFATYDRLVETTLGLLEQSDALEELGERGRRRMEAWPWTRCLRDVLTTTDGAARDIGDPGRTVTLVCGPPGAALTRGAPAGRLDEVLSAGTDELLALGGSSRTSLGAPPPTDWQTDPRVATLRDRVLGELAEIPGGAVIDPALGLVLPFWLELFETLDRPVTVRLQIESPTAVASHRAATGEQPIVTVLLWLSYTLFAEAFSREARRELVVSEPETLPPALGFKAGQLAARVHAALATQPPDLDAVDEVVDQYLAAMEIYFPLLVEGATSVS